MRFKPLERPRAPCGAWLIRGVSFGLAGWMPQNMRQQLGSQVWGLEGGWESGSSLWGAEILQRQTKHPLLFVLFPCKGCLSWAVARSDCCASPCPALLGISCCASPCPDLPCWEFPAAHLHALPCWEFLVPTQARRKGEAAEMNLGVEKSGLHPSYILYNAFSRSWAVDLTRDPSEL